MFKFAHQTREAGKNEHGILFYLSILEAAFLSLRHPFPAPVKMLGVPAFGSCQIFHTMAKKREREVMKGTSNHHPELAHSLHPLEQRCTGSRQAVGHQWKTDPVPVGCQAPAGRWDTGLGLGSDPARHFLKLSKIADLGPFNKGLVCLHGKELLDMHSCSVNRHQ